MKPLTVALALLAACSPAGATPDVTWTTPPHHVVPAHLQEPADGHRS